MFSALKLPHWAQLILAFAVLAITWVMTKNASGDIALPAGVISVLTVIKTVIGLFSDPPSNKKDPPGPGSTIAMNALVAIAALFIGGLFIAACGQPLFPTLAKVEQVVARDLEAGAPDSQIASDVCQALGGNATTDAVCADVEIIIQDAVAILIDTKVLSPAAVAHARKYMGAHPRINGVILLTPAPGGKTVAQ